MLERAADESMPSADTTAPTRRVAAADDEGGRRERESAGLVSRVSWQPPPDTFDAGAERRREPEPDDADTAALRAALRAWTPPDDAVAWPPRPRRRGGQARAPEDLERQAAAGLELVEAVERGDVVPWQPPTGTAQAGLEVYQRDRRTR